MKRKFPQAVAKALLQQNKLMSETYVVVLTGITREAMALLKPTIMDLQGIIAISDTHRTDNAGRWYILVHEKSFRSVRKTLSKSIHEWFKALPLTIQEPIPVGFGNPQVHKKYFDDDDDSSSGQASYMSTCAQSYGTIDDYTEGIIYHPPNDGPSTSYADAVKRTTTTTSPNSPADTATTHPDTVEVQNYRSVIASLQSDVTIANLQAEVQNLRAQIRAQTGVQTPSTVTEASTHPKESPISARMALIETSMASMTREFSKWMAANHNPTTDLTIRREQDQIKRPETSPSSQSKKKVDRKDTPDRNDPMLTQPSLGEPRKQLFIEHRSPHGYDIHHPQYLYRDNGDGSLIEVGLAGPDDFDEHGNPKGPRPASSQDPYTTTIQRLDLPSPPSPMQIQDTPENEQLGQPSPTREARSPVMGSPPSLPAEGAQTVNE
jgi:hypothetical protein